MPKNLEYRCWFSVNPHQQKSRYKDLEQKAADIFLRFMKDKNYGDAVRVFSFHIYVEQPVNYGNHTDYIYSGSACGSAHIDKPFFDSISPDEKIKWMLNASLVLLKYLTGRMPLPKDFPATALVAGFEMFLSENQLLVDEQEARTHIIKPFDTTRFDFVVTSTGEVKEKHIHYDLNDIGDYINNHIAGLTFGAAIRTFQFGYEIADSRGKLTHYAATRDLRRYSPRYKSLLIVKQFDYRELKDLPAAEQFGLLKSKILEAIDNIDLMPRRPKDFNKQQFYTAIESILAAYNKKHDLS